MFEITDVKIALNEGTGSKLRAFATITLDDVFVIRDIKIIDGKKGLFVAMPCIQISEKCPSCGRRNVVHSRYCSNCGKALPDFSEHMPEARKEEYKDIAHPICADCRSYVENTIVSAYKERLSTAHITHRA